MHGTFLAYDVQVEIVSVPLESVAHEVEGPRGEYGGYGRLQVGLVYLVPRLYVKFAHQVVGFVLCDSLESDARKHYGYLPDVDGGRALELRDIRTEPALQFLGYGLGRESLVVHDYAFLYVVGFYEVGVRPRVNAVAGVDLGAYRLHFLHVVTVQDGDVGHALHLEFV